MKEVGEYIQLLNRRLAWQWHYRNDESVGYLRLVGKRKPLWCGGLFQLEFKGFVRDLHGLVVEHVSFVNKEIGRSRPSTLPAFMKYTIRWCMQHGFVVTPSDKDGVMVLRKKESMSYMMEEKLRVAHTALAVEPSTRWKWNAQNVALTASSVT